MSYTLNRKGAQIDVIFNRAAAGGEIDQDIALKAPLDSPALTGTPTAPTPDEGDSSTRIATTEFVAAATAGAITDTAGPAPLVSFPDGSGLPFKEMNIALVPIQSGSGTPSPDNVRPISGRTGAEAVVGGVNVLNPSTAYTGANVTHTVNADGSETFSNGGGSAQSNGWLLTGLLPAGQYTLTSFGGGNVYVQLVAGDYSHVVSNGTHYTFNYDGESFFRLLQNNLAAGTSETYKLILSVGSTVPTSFEGFIGTTYPITWTDEAGTVYKGSVDFVSGVLTVTHGITDLRDLYYTKRNTAGAHWEFLATKADAEPAPSASALADILCSCYPSISANDAWNGTMGINIATSGGQTTVFICDENYSDPDVFKTAVTGQKLVYELATPLSYSLAGLTIPTLKGENNVWADCGQSEMTYYADLKAYIDKKIAEAL